MIQKAYSLESKKLIYLRALIVILLAGFVISCTSNIKNHGYIPSKSELENLVIGKDTEKSVSKKIGLPATAGLEGSYYYVRSTFNAPGFKSPELIDRKVVVLSFDQLKKLKNIELSSGLDLNFKNNLKFIPYNDIDYSKKILDKYKKKNDVCNY